MSSRGIVEYDQSDDREKKIDNYLHKFDVYLGFVVGIFYRKTRHSRKKFEQGGKWYDDCKRHSDGLLVKEKRDWLKGKLLLLPDL